MTASVLFCSSTPLPPKTSRRRPPITTAIPSPPPRRLQNFLLHTAAAALSFSFVAFPLPYLAAEPPGVASQPLAAAEICTEPEKEEAVEDPQSVTNGGLVDEAWEVVDQGFFAEAGSRPWSPELWRIHCNNDDGHARVEPHSYLTQ